MPDLSSFSIIALLAAVAAAAGGVVLLRQRGKGARKQDKARAPSGRGPAPAHKPQAAPTRQPDRAAPARPEAPAAKPPPRIAQAPAAASAVPKALRTPESPASAPTPPRVQPPRARPDEPRAPAATSAAPPPPPNIAPPPTLRQAPPAPAPVPARPVATQPEPRPTPRPQTAPPASISTPAATSTAPPAAALPRRILIVDDSAVVRAKLGKLLAGRGWSVTQARDGADALRLLGSSEVDLVITDLEMPQMDGRELIAALRGRPLPILAITGHEAPPAAESLGSAVRAVLHKPWDERALLDAVEAAVGPLSTLIAS